MRIVVIGGTGLVGSKLVTQLRGCGHDAGAASPSTGVNAVTGEGLRQVLEGAAVVVDASNPPSFEDDAALRFFQTSTRNVLDAAVAAGVGHHVALSVVGSDRLTESGYFRAKVAQERMITQSQLAYSIIRATQFFEILQTIIDASTDGDVVRVPPVLVQPMAADDAAAAAAPVAVGPPANGIVEMAGPEQLRLDEIVRRGLDEDHDPRLLIVDPVAPFFGAELLERTLLPAEGALIAPTRFSSWLERTSNSPSGT
jgi:uncharacterized protein YbjT (DUF2867 family)